MKSITIVFGTRPECIKIVPLIKEAENRKIPTNVIYLTQHQNHVEEVLELFEIRNYLKVDVQRKSNSLSDYFSQALHGLDHILDKFPDTDVFVQGDTATTLVSSFVAFNQRKRLHHIEAGLRSGDTGNPFPEEMNRRLVSQLADFHYAPTKNNYQNLLKENIDKKRIFITGNTIIDSLKLLENTHKFGEIDSSVQEYVNKYEKIILVTAHRREKWGEEYVKLLQDLISIKTQLTNVGIIFVTHPNPDLAKVVEKNLKLFQDIFTLPPQRYDHFVALMKLSDLIISDSGGIQEEATFLGNIVFVIRKITERSEGLNSAQLRLVEKNLCNEVLLYFAALSERKSKDLAANKLIFGNGFASKKILDIAESH
jgi:UDP-N-acetylglucosamine 2-epimerase (non-hydrolysing)